MFSQLTRWVLALAIILSPLAVVSPADATPTAPVVSVNTAQADKVEHTLARKQAKASVDEGGCGFLKRCIWFNRDAQKLLAAGALAGAATIVCVIGGPAACVVAAVIAAVAMEYINQRGGICGGSSPIGPYYKPRLRVRYLPTIGGAQCTW